MAGLSYIKWPKGFKQNIESKVALYFSLELKPTNTKLLVFKYYQALSETLLI